MIGVAFDIGGTFTDFVLSDDRTGATHALKVPTSVHNLGEAVIEGLEKLLSATDVPGESIDVVLHVRLWGYFPRDGEAPGCVLLTHCGSRSCHGCVMKADPQTGSNQRNCMAWERCDGMNWLPVGSTPLLPLKSHTSSERRLHHL